LTVLISHATLFSCKLFRLLVCGSSEMAHSVFSELL
jgi:hypothetical protein